MAAVGQFRPKPPSLKIGKETNRGAYGSVHFEELDGEPVAVKRIHRLLLEAAKGQSDFELVLTDFKRECQLLEQLNHPNLVDFRGAFYDEAIDEPILAMERMAENLQELFQRSQTGLSLQKQLEICLGITCGLRFLHTCTPPIVHRDLTDKNVMFDKDGVVKIGDFGQSKLKANNADYFSTAQPGAIPFMPPEAMQEQSHYNEKLDIFSLGVIMLEVATQQPPCVGLVGIGMKKEILRRTKDLSKLEEDHPLKPLILSCLEDDPKERPDTEALFTQLQALVEGPKLEDEAEVDPSIPQPKTPLEALHQRLDKYKSGVEGAKAEGNGSKARRMGRIVSQYEDAIKAVKAGKQVDFSELPTPPGFPPIPVGGAPLPTRPAPSGVSSPPKVTQNAQQQLALLQQRCSEYTSAAVRHRDVGDREEALRLLKYIKDLKVYIDLSKQGIPVDETAIPPPLHEEGSGAVSPPKLSSTPSKSVKASDGDDDTFQLIEDQIQKQIDFCEENAAVYEKFSNQPEASCFRNMAEDCKQELLSIKGLRRQGFAPPHFTMEMRTANLLHGFPDLSSSECEVEVIKLVDAPKDQTVYVEIEFPYPSDDTPKDQTPKTKDEVNPQLNSSHKFSIDRKHKRAMTRAFTRGVKLTLWQHKALRKDTALGTATFKCEDLETKAEVRDLISFYDGRKEMSQKVEVAVRLREPLSGPDVEEKQIKWLVFSEQIVKKSKVAMPKAQLEKDRSTAGAPAQTSLAGPVKLKETFSQSALKLEYQLAQGKPELQEQIEKKLQNVQQMLQTKRISAPYYKKGVEASIAKETKLYQQYSKAGRQEEAKVLMERVKAMQTEFKKL